ncbi:AT-rich interactive domain-containing protein 2-like isoform X2 [Dreissena polymorpha]|uniref:AT-rich interactive domain-containing protein 2-like isoform X2 n=1 Tax=Dreissena polymorpha TaxID=45954 RepID=UPI00226413F5|nr:AT-rich interactive domain-containing protein 2-like isoform X2 [Dreissena polymorpha]
MAKQLNKDKQRYEHEKSEFIEGLRNFHYNRGTSFHLTPKCGNIDVDLYLLYQNVTSRGGWKKVTEDQLWEEILGEMKMPVACLNSDQALKIIYIRYLNIYEQIHFLGEDPKTADGRRDDEGPIRKKQCGPQYNVHLSYNYSQHDIAANLRGGMGLCTSYARYSDYEKLEKSLMSGLPNEVDFVVNVCTLLSNESKHTLRLDRCCTLVRLLMAHCGLFDEEPDSFERLYENCWRKNSDRDFTRFWFDTVHHPEARKIISYTREDKRCLCGSEVLQLGRNLGVEDKEGIRITQIAIIIRNLSFDAVNMKILANNYLVFRFLLLCIHCEYGTLRQLGLDTIGNLAGQFILDTADPRCNTMLDLIVNFISSNDKFAVVTGLEMVSKLSRLEDNEYVLSEKLDSSVYEEISKYLTIHDIQLIVYSLEALYQLSEIGEVTNNKIAETSNTVETLISLITVEAQSYGPNSLIGIKVVEYCPPPHLTGGPVEGTTGSVGPPGEAAPQPLSPGQTTGAAPQPMSPGQTPGQPPTQKKSGADKIVPPEPPVPPSPLEVSTCNWLQASYHSTGPADVVSHVHLYKEYLAFCTKFQLAQPLSSRDFLKTLQIVFPKSASVMIQKADGVREMCVQGLRKRPSQLPFAISCPDVLDSMSCVPTNQPVQTNQTSAGLANLQLPHSTSLPSQAPATVAMVTLGHSSGHMIQVSAPVININSQQRVACSTVTVPFKQIGGGLVAQGYVSDPQPPTPSTTSSMAKTQNIVKKKIAAKKIQPVLPKVESSNSGPNLQPIVPKIVSMPVQATMAQPQQYITQEGVVYQAIQDQQNPENKVFVKTLLAQKIRTGNVIIQQPIPGGVMNVDISGGGDGQAIQYQTSFPQQTAFFQYAAPQVSGTQNILQNNQTVSNVQTYVVQPNGEMYMHTPTSNMAPHMVSQAVMMPQQQLIVSQTPLMMPHQFVPQQQFINASLQQSQNVAKSQIITHSQSVCGQPFIVHPSSTIPLSSTAVCEPSSSLSSSPVTLPSSCSSSLQPSVLNSLSESSVNNSNYLIDSSNHSSSQTMSHSMEGKPFGDNNNVTENPQETVEHLDLDTEVPSSESNIISAVGDVLNPTNTNISTRAEIEFAVGSIMEDSNDGGDDGPVMIENDGNELMFEQQAYAMGSTENATREIFAGDSEAALAVEQLGQMEGTDDQETETTVVDDAMCGSETVCEDEHGMDTRETVEAYDNAVISEDQIMNDQIVDNGESNSGHAGSKEGSAEKETVLSDAELIAKFRAETPINVPLVAENGLFEQDFEAQMAVENLLKDVEFSVKDEDSGEINRMFSQGTGSSKTSSQKTDKSHAVDDSRRLIESQNTKMIGNHIEKPGSDSAVKHSLEKTAVNGIGMNHGKPLLNGDIGSPESPCVPSPGLVNGIDKLVNGIGDEKEESYDKTVDKVLKINGVVNHKISSEKQLTLTDNVVSGHNEISDNVGDTLSSEVKTNDILAQSMMEIDKSDGDSNSSDKAVGDEGDILARSILENGIQPGDCEIPDSDPVTKQMIPGTMYGKIMTVTYSGNTMPIPFASNAIVTSNTKSNQINVCNSRHIPTPESARDGELSCDSTSSSIAMSELSLVISEKHSSSKNQSKSGSKESKSKSLASPKAVSVDSKKSKSASKKRSRSKSGGSGSSDSRPSSATSPGVAATPLPEFMCEWTNCRQCFDNTRKVFSHVASAHLRTEYDGLCKWDGCEALIRKRWSLFTHVQDHHCSESSLRVAAQRRLQAFQTGQKIAAPTVPAMVYPNDAANQAIKRYLPKPPYPEFTEGREGPVTKHIRLTSALILRNLARYSREGRSVLRKHERLISYSCMSAVEASTALASCLQELQRP